MKRVFKFFTEGENASLYSSWFISSFPIKHFAEMDKMMYLFLDYASKLGIPASMKYLRAFLKTDAKRLMFEHNIKINEIGVADFNDPAQLEEGFRVMAVALQQYYEVLVTAEDFSSTLSDFKVAVREFLIGKKKELLTKLIMDSYSSLNSEEIDDIFGRIGYDIEEISDTYSDEKIGDLDFLLNNRLDEGKAGSMTKVCPTEVPCIDGDVGGIFERMIFTYTGLAGSGKSRFASHYFTYIPAVLFGVDVRYDSLELSEGQIENILIAIHIINIWKGKIKIPDSVINKGELDDDAMKYYNAARQDLFNNPKYGKIYINDKPLVVEKFYSSARQFLSFHKNVKVWNIDYAGMAISQPQSRYASKLNTKADIIAKLYNDVRRVANLTGCAFMMLNQYNREGAEKAKAGKTIDQGDIQGGQTVHQFTDYNIYSVQTPEQKAASLLDMTADKVRGAKGFSRVLFTTDLSVSKFEQMKGKGSQV